jgi:hypothetical protein
MAGTDGNGPKVGDGGRQRNTMANLLSKYQVDYKNPGGAQALPALDPASTANYYSQLGGLYAGYQTQLLAQKQQRVGLRAGFGEAQAGIRAQLVSGISQTQNANIERGVAGSSAASQQEIGVRADAAAQTATAKRQMLEGLAGSRLQDQQAGVDFFQSSQQLEAQKLAQQQATLAQQLQSNLIVSGQETQMDALKAIYQSLMQGGGGGQTGNGQQPGQRQPGFNIQQWQKDQARRAGYGDDVGGYLQHIWADKLGIGA